MKSYFFAFIFTVSTLFAFAQNSSVKVYPTLIGDSTTILSDVNLSESVYPSFNVKFERLAHKAIIEDKVYHNVIIEIEATAIKDKDYKGVNIIVKDVISKKKIYKGNFSGYLYGFSDRSLQVGVDNVLLQMILFKPEKYEWVLVIQESGIY